ncbi:MAG: hypothetical protein ACRDI3_04865 [Actinomycetota bacterium]
MRRLLLAAFLVALLVPTIMAGVSAADHVFALPDAADCLNMAAPGAVVTDPVQPDRGAACVSDGNAGNGIEYYLGGEAAAESPHPDADPASDLPGDACGAFVVGGDVLAATRADDPATSTNESLDWDWNHTHDPDGIPGSGDEVLHHHTCD